MMVCLQSSVSSELQSFNSLSSPCYYILSSVTLSVAVILEGLPSCSHSWTVRSTLRCFLQESPLSWAGSQVQSQLSSLHLTLAISRAGGQLEVIKSVQSLDCLFIPARFSSLFYYFIKGTLPLMLRCIYSITQFIIESRHLRGHHDTPSRY